MGFISDKEQLSDLNDKNVLFDIWKILGGDIKNHITLNNCRILLLAIMGTYVEPSIIKEEEKLIKIHDKAFGRFNE